MLPAFLLSLREGLEIALIIGIVLGALRKMNRAPLVPAVWGGVGAAAFASLLVGGLLYALGAELAGPAEPIFEGLTMLLAAGVLTWMIFWMARQSRYIKGELEAGVRRATKEAGAKALFLLAFIAVVREGIELALFLAAAAFSTNAVQTVVGSLLGLAAAAALGWALFASTLRLDLRRFFQVTGVLLILFAAGLVAHGIHELNEVGWIPALVEHVWDTKFLLDEASLLGSVLKTLFGYNSQPSLTEVVAYLSYFTAIVVGLRLSSQRVPALKET